MFRENKKPREKTAIADMSQYSVESGRLSAERQYDNLLKERQILTTHKLELEQKLCNHKRDYDCPAGIVERRKIVEEINNIQKRLIKLKPTLTKLHDAKSRPIRPFAEVAEEMLIVLKRIEEVLKEK